MEGNGGPVFWPSVSALAPVCEGSGIGYGRSRYKAQYSPRHGRERRPFLGLYVLRDNLLGASRLAPDGGLVGASEAILCIGSSTPDRIRPVATAAY